MMDNNRQATKIATNRIIMFNKIPKAGPGIRKTLKSCVLAVNKKIVLNCPLQFIITNLVHLCSKPKRNCEKQNYYIVRPNIGQANKILCFLLPRSSVLTSLVG